MSLSGKYAFQAKEPVSNASSFFSFSIPFKYWTIFALLASDDSVGCKYFTIFFARGLNFSPSLVAYVGASLEGAISFFRTFAQTIPSRVGVNEHGSRCNQHPVGQLRVVRYNDHNYNNNNRRKKKKLLL